jgi:KipI family sensor histidine kinase inhibitor
VSGRDDGLAVLPYGDRALLVEVTGLDAVAAVRAALEHDPLPGQVDLVPAARTVLVLLDRPPADTDTARLRRLSLTPPPDDDALRAVDLPVVFDGPDLDDVASLTGLAVPQLVAELTAAELTVAFGGFAPGFGYLTGLPEHLHVPRRSTPRTRVPPGSVGLAGQRVVLQRGPDGGDRVEPGDLDQQRPVAVRQHGEAVVPPAHAAMMARRRPGAWRGRRRGRIDS